MSICPPLPIRLSAVAMSICLSIAVRAVAMADSAIALGRRDSGEWAFGAGRGFAARHDAQAAALNNCGGELNKCAVVETFSDTCVAVAVPDSDVGYAVERDRDLVVARETALTSCRAKGASCRIVEEVCDAEDHRPASVARTDESFLQLLLSWQTCFERPAPHMNFVNALAACDHVGAFPNLRPKERERVWRQRTKLSEARDRARETSAE